MFKAVLNVWVASEVFNVGGKIIKDLNTKYDTQPDVSEINGC